MTPAAAGTAAPSWAGSARELAGGAAALALASAAAYALLLQHRFYGDGANLTEGYLSGGSIENYNVLFLLLCRAVGALAPVEPLRVPHVVSAVAGALGVGLSFPVLRFFGLGRGRALFGCTLLALAPATLFFSTTAEVHSLHLACVALCACVTLYAPWRRPAVALWATALVFPLLFWSHVTAALLGPGWVLLVQAARARSAEPFRWRTLILVVGPVLLAMLVAAMALANLYRHGSLTADASELVYWLEDAFRPPLADRMVVHGWLIPLAALVPLAAWGWIRSRPRGWDEAALATLVLPSLAFFLVYGVPERGAYFLGSILFWAVLAARALPAAPRTGAARLVAGGIVAAHAAAGVALVREHDRGFRNEERVAMVREALGEEGYLISGGSWSLDVHHFLPGVTEASVWLVLRRYRGTDASPVEVARSVVDELAGLVEGNPVAFDLSHRAQLDDPVVRENLRWLDPLEAELSRRFETELYPHPHWPMLRLRPPGAVPGDG